MISTIERVLFLKSVPLFRTLTGENLAPIAGIADEVHFAPGESLIRQGEAGDCLYVLVDGQVDVVLDGRVTVARVGVRGILGEMAVLTAAPRTASCVAAVETLALRIAREDFWELLREHPEVALGVIREMSTRLEELLRKLEG